MLGPRSGCDCHANKQGSPILVPYTCALDTSYWSALGACHPRADSIVRQRGRGLLDKRGGERPG
eukprot:5329869-Pyramimonas_sp.AAC.1